MKIGKEYEKEVIAHSRIKIKKILDVNK